MVVWQYAKDIHDARIVPSSFIVPPSIGIQAMRSTGIVTHIVMLLAGGFGGCALLQAPLGGVVPLRCTLPTPPNHAIAEELVCELVSDFALPEQYRQNVRNSSPVRAGCLDLRGIEVRGTTSAAPLPVAEELRKRLLPKDIAAQLERILIKEWHQEHWHGDQSIRYQSVIEGVSMPCSYAEFTVWHPTKTSTRVLANAYACLYRVTSRGGSVRLLDARRAFERSRAWERVKPIEPVTRVYLHYLPSASTFELPPLRRITARPVWCFYGTDRLMGDVVTCQSLLIDAVNGTDFHQSIIRADPD